MSVLISLTALSVGSVETEITSLLSGRALRRDMRSFMSAQPPLVCEGCCSANSLTQPQGYVEHKSAQRWVLLAVGCGFSCSGPPPFWRILGIAIVTWMVRSVTQWNLCFYIVKQISISNILTIHVTSGVPPASPLVTSLVGSRLQD